jgi:NADH:ubiquinone oxidoreductase subunit 3 (subunit A)
MLAEYAGVLIVVTLGLVIVCAMLGVHLLLGPHREFAEKQEPFECGEHRSSRRSSAMR